MNDDMTVIVIESINSNPKLDGCQKIDLIRRVMSDCREKQIGKIIVDAIKRGPYKKKEIVDATPVKRGRGRPRKISPNAQRMIENSRLLDKENGVGHE